MTLTQVWGSLVIFLFCPMLGGLPLVGWLIYALTGKQLAQLGTGNVSVSAAFYHGGRLMGILAVLIEASKGIGAVLLARYFFPTAPAWELIALIALTMGRYWVGRGAGTTNVFWGVLVHDYIAALFILLIGGISFTIFRDRHSGRLAVLFLLSLVLAIRNPHQPALIAAAITLSILLAWIYQQIPDDLDLSTEEVHPESQKMFGFFRGKGSIISLDSQLDAAKVGNKAATLSQLKRWGYSIPQGWILNAGDDPRYLINFLQPSPEQPFVVRSSAMGEDSQSASAAGQYTTILHVTDPEGMENAILNCFADYNNPAAVQYRRTHQQLESTMAVLVQKQIKGVFSGVAFSRDPVNQLNRAVVIEALPGDAIKVVSGQVTPQQYRVYLLEEGQEKKLEEPEETENEPLAPINAQIEGNGDFPETILTEIALLARELENRYYGIPQDIEWTYDGQKLWLLQSRPVTTLRPIWTRKIAAEVIPGLIHPLTWSINRPLTCGVWGDIFTLVLGKQGKDFDFEETATLHYSRAYFNATLLGQIFLAMGLPPESLEFLTRGAKFSKPPLLSTVANLPGLWRLLGRERRLIQDFEQDYQDKFAPVLESLEAQTTVDLYSTDLLYRIENILSVLESATYYSIMAPLSLAVRQKIFRVEEQDLDNSQTPEVESLRALALLADDASKLVPLSQLNSDSCPSLFAYLADHRDGESILEQFNQWLDVYGYLSEVATDIAVPRWKEDPRPVRELFTRCWFNEQFRLQLIHKKESQPKQDWLTNSVQKRLNLKGQVTKVYSQLLAHLRWSCLALAGVFLESGLLTQWGDIFLLKLEEIQLLAQDDHHNLQGSLPQLLSDRRSQLEQDGKITSVPYVVYGETPLSSFLPEITSLDTQQQLVGIGASPGQIVGKVKVLHRLESIADIDRQTILVVPYTDSGWSPVLSLAGGLIAEVGGRLSHGAIIAREYGIPAVMDIPDATHRLRDGQQVLLDGQQGIVKVISH